MYNCMQLAHLAGVETGYMYYCYYGTACAIGPPAAHLALSCYDYTPTRTYDDEPFAHPRPHYGDDPYCA